jgi:hypothetical protein
MMGRDEHVCAKEITAELGVGEHAPPAADLEIAGKHDLESAELNEHDKT